MTKKSDKTESELFELGKALLINWGRFQRAEYNPIPSKKPPPSPTFSQHCPQYATRIASEWFEPDQATKTEDIVVREITSERQRVAVELFFRSPQCHGNYTQSYKRFTKVTDLKVSESTYKRLIKRICMRVGAEFVNNS